MNRYFRQKYLHWPHLGWINSLSRTIETCWQPWFLKHLATEDPVKGKASLLQLLFRGRRSEASQNVRQEGVRAANLSENSQILDSVMCNITSLASTSLSAKRV